MPRGGARGAQQRIKPVEQDIIRFKVDRTKIAHRVWYRGAWMTYDEIASLPDVTVSRYSIADRIKRGVDPAKPHRVKVRRRLPEKRFHGSYVDDRDIPIIRLVQSFIKCLPPNMGAYRVDGIKGAREALGEIGEVVH